MKIYYISEVKTRFLGLSASALSSQIVLLKPSTLLLLLLCWFTSAKAQTTPCSTPAISGTLNACAGSGSTLSSTTSGGTWTSSNTSVAMVVSGTGVVSAVAAGTATISYTVSGGCVGTTVYTVNPLPDAITLTIPSSLCGGETSEYDISPMVYDGIFFTSHPNVGIDYPTFGQMEVFNDGTTIINATVYYIRYNACGSHTDSANIEIKPMPTNIVGNTMLNVGEIDTITSVSPGGIWSSSNPSRATINSISGILTTLSPGVTTISYTQIGGCYRSLPIAIDDGYPNAVGKINTIIGNGTAGYSPDGTSAGSALVTSPNLVDIDSAGNIYYIEGRYIRKKSTDNIITTIAGNGSSRVDGNEFDSEFGITPATGIPLRDGIEAMTVDKHGNVYVFGLGGIERISTDGHLSLVAGYSHYYSYGSTAGVLIDEPAIAPGFTINYVNGMCTDNNGDLYYTDYYVGSVNKITIATNRVNTVAGKGTSYFGSAYEYYHTYNDVPATVAFLNEPRDVAVGKDGSIYIAETGGRKVLKVDTSGIIHTIAGESFMYSSDYGNGGPANLSRVSVNKITVDSSGNLYISNDTVIRRISNEGIITAFGGTGSTVYNGECKNTDIANIVAIDFAVDKDGGLIIAEGGNNRIRKIQNTDLYSPIITGRFTLTLADTSQLAASLPTGTWSSSNTSVATVDGTGKVISVSVGTTTISYMLADTCISPVATTVIYVNTTPEDTLTLSGVSSVCPGSSTTISASVSGGSWISSNTSIATVSSAGVVTGVTSGTCIISYTVSDSTGTDTATLLITVLPTAPATPTITGLGAVCAEFNIALSASPTGGTWSSSNATIATIETTTGTVSALTGGTCTMSYSLSNTCGTAVATKVITVNPIPSSIGSASGFFAVVVGSTVTLNSSPASGTWSSSSANATVNPATGVVTGVTVGTSMISYTNTFGCYRNVLLSITSPADTTTSLKIYTIAGTGIIGFSGDGGLASAAQFNSPHGIHIDTSGNIYVNDHSNYAVRKINTSGIINTVVGNGTAGYSGDGGPATAAKVNQVFDVITDAAGNMYIGDGANHRIRKISAAGIITTIAGTGTAGYGGDGGPATAAVINRPGSIALDNAGNIYFAEIYGHRVRKINVSTGIISTIAGTGTVGYTGNGGAATAAKLSYPNFLHIDAANNIYITDNGNHTIRKISTSGIITTIAGTGVAGFSGDGGAATAAKLSYPGGIDIDASGNVFITDHVNNRIRKINTSGIISTYAAIGTAGFSGDCGPATAAKINVPTDVKLAPNGNLHIADNQNNRIRIITNSNVITGTMGVCTGSTSPLVHSVSGGVWSSSNASVATVGSSSGIVTGVAAGTVTISYVFSGSCGASVVVTVIAAPAAITGLSTVNVGATTTLSSATTGGIWTSSNTSVANVVSGTGIVSGVAAGTATISYTNTFGCFRSVLINVYSLPDTSTTLRIYTIAGTGVAGYSGDGGLATDAKLNKQSYLAKDLSGNIYFSDRYNRRVRKIATNGIITTVAGNGTSGSGGDGGPATAAPIAQVSGLALDADGNLYIGDYDGNKIRKVNTAGIITTFAGTGASSSTGDGGHATAASIKTPIGLSFDHSGNLLIVEQYGHKVRKITPGSNIISTIIGTGVVGYTGNGGPATAAKISYPNTLFIDSADNIYVTDNGNHALRKINTAGIISTIAGNGLEGFLGDGGPATSARLDYPAGATMDTEGNIYIADYGNHRVRKINTSGIISTYVGTGTSGYNSDCINPTTAKIYFPVDVIMSNDGGLIISDESNNRIRKVHTSNNIPVLISGVTDLCNGSTSTLTSTNSGGTWTSSNTAVATVSASGIVMGTGAGTVVISYSNSDTCGSATGSIVVTVSDIIAMGTIVGSSELCIGSSTTLTSAITGGSWISSNIGIATVGSTGIVTGIGNGVVVITYSKTNTCGTAIATKTITVNSTPIAGTIAGSSTVCSGSTLALTSTVSGGTWSSSNTTVANIGSTTGSLSAIAAGTCIISYSNTNTCGTAIATKTITVNSTPIAGTVTGASTVCSGSTLALTSTVSGGTWSSSNTTVANIGSTTGSLSAIAAGTCIISYSSTNTCGTAVATKIITVNPTPSTISSSSGFFAVEVGSTITLSTSPTGGAWGSSNAYATVNPVTGVVTGVAAGAANISYTNTSGCYRVVFLSITSFADTLLEKRIYTIAGTGVAGFSGDGGLAINAQINKQSYLAKDISGNIYFSDRYNRRVRKIATNGIITTVAGNGTSGSGGDGGPATAAQIAQVSGLALDADGNLYIGDYDGNKIRKVNTAGIITTFAGIGASSSTGDGGHATAASIKTPIGLSFDHSGNLLIVEQYGHRVRKISPSSNIISTIIGTGIIGYTGNGGPATAATISYPNTIFIDSADNIYVTDNGNHALRKIDNSGIISTIAGNGLEGFSGDGGPATSARLDYPAGATMDASGNIYIADYGNHRVRKINTSGIISTYAGTGAPGFNSDCINPTTAKINFPLDVIMSNDGGLVISDESNNRLRKVHTSNNIPVLLSGTTELCDGSTTTLTSSNSGGTWTSSNTAVATVSASGIVTGTGVGTALISYSNSDTCGSATGSIVVTVSDSIAMGTIAGSSELCIGASATLTSAITGGSWTSSDTEIATVASTGSVTGIGNGVVVITYSKINTCGTAIASKTITVNSTPIAGTITGASSVNAGASITLTNTSSGGAWSSSNTSVATVGTTGVVTGVSSGTSTISYTVSNSCGSASSTKIVSVNVSLETPITGAFSVCLGSTTALSNATSGGSWSSSNAAIATINSDGLVTGTSAGTAVISYTLFTTTVTAIVTVSPLAVAGTLGGATSVCVGSTATITKTGTGGEWSSSAPATATVGTTGIVSGLTAGTTTISYTVSNGCGSVAATRIVTVIALPDAGTISGASAVCRTTTTTLTSTVAGGTWSSNYAAGASVNTSTGLVTGLSAGSFTISYRMAGSCGTSTATFPITVLNAPSLGTISGTATVCASATTTLTNTTAGGTWSSTNTGVATIGVATSGVVTGVAAGTSTISYNVTNICGSATVTRVVTVNPLPVAAVITGAATLSAGTTTTLTATPAAGTWLSGSGAIASVNASTGVVNGVSAGIATISYNRSNTCGIATATVAVTVSAATTPITGTRVVCAGATTNLANATAGGTWSTANAAIATIGTTGVVTGVAAGTTTVTYAFSGGGNVTATVTVNAAPAAYTGSGIVCIGSQLNLGSIIPGCTWTSGTPSRASVVTATGVVTGVSLGTVNISYVSAGCRTITQLTVNAALATTTGATSPCTGSSITLSNATPGGTWSSSNTARATIAETTGVLAAISGGTVTISYTISAGCVRTTTVTVGTPTPITGNPNVCLGQSSYMSSTGGTWSGSSNPAVASLAFNGFVTGVTEGTAVITYRSISNATCFVTLTVTVHPLPSVIVPVDLCPTETATLTSSPAGGTWTSAFPLKASVDPASGLVTGVILNSSAANVVNITYTLPTTCSRTAIVTVNQVPAPIGGGVRNICVAGTTTLANSTSGGTWSSASPSIAAVTAGGVVTGTSAGLATISYTNTVGCASTAEVTVNAMPGANSGTASLCRTATTTLSNAAGAGTWTSSNSSTASVGMSTGIVTGTNVGTANITYHRATGCTSVTVVTVNSCARPGMTEGTDGDNSVFTVSPNPTTGAINLTTDVAGKVVIYTIDGKQLQQYEAKAGTTAISLPSGMASGVYMLRFTGAEGSSKMVRLVYQQ